MREKFRSWSARFHHVKKPILKFYGQKCSFHPTEWVKTNLANRYVRNPGVGRGLERESSVFMRPRVHESMSHESMSPRVSAIAVITVEPADKISFVYNCMQTRLRGQYNGKWPISLVCVLTPLVTAITAITQTNRAVFKWQSKVITWLRLLRLVIGLKDSRQFFNQWQAKPNPIAPCTRDFSRA